MGQMMSFDMADRAAVRRQLHRAEGQLRGVTASPDGEHDEAVSQLKKLSLALG